MMSDRTNTSACAAPAASNASPATMHRTPCWPAIMTSNYLKFLQILPQMPGEELLRALSRIGQREAIGLVALLGLARVVEGMVRPFISDEIDLASPPFHRGGERLTDPR